MLFNLSLLLKVDFHNPPHTHVNFMGKTKIGAMYEVSSEFRKCKGSERFKFYVYA